MADELRDPGPATGVAEPDPGRRTAVVLVGAGTRARSWLEPLCHSGRLQLVATVARADPSLIAGIPHYGQIEAAMERHPNAAFAVALPPRAGLDAALQLAAVNRPGIVEAPLDDALVEADLGPEAEGVRVAHGWATLPGLSAIEAVMRHIGGGRLQIDVAGLPEEDHGDLSEVLVHAVAVVRRLLPLSSVSAARHGDDGALEAVFTAPSASGGWIARLRLVTRGRRIAVEVAGAGEPTRWSWERDRESVMRGGMPLVAPRATPVAAVRALAQLLPQAARGDGLVEAASVMRLTRDCRAHLPARLALGARPLRQSASIGRRRPTDLLGRLGLCAELVQNGGRVPCQLTLEPPAEPFELWPFRAGIKALAFLTVRPDEVDRTLGFFGGAPHERRERRVQVDAQDRWTDRRDQGEPRVELYIARDRQTARQAAHLQAEVDPTRAVRELGALAGYPSCCVDAFAAQDDRANNTRNRYFTSARTLPPDGSAKGVWPWQLNNLFVMVVPFFPCTYRCQRALEWAQVTLEGLAQAHAAFARDLRAALARPVLYFDDDSQIAFDGEWDGEGIVYRDVVLPHAATEALVAFATAIGAGDRLSFDDRTLTVERRGEVVGRWARTDPALGFVAPFGVAAAGRVR